MKPEGPKMSEYVPKPTDGEVTPPTWSPENGDEIMEPEWTPE